MIVTWVSLEDFVGQYAPVLILLAAALVYALLAHFDTPGAQIDGREYTWDDWYAGRRPDDR